MKFYDFIDRDPPIGSLVVIEGTEALLADSAIARISDRLLDKATRDLNCDRFVASRIASMEEVAAACAAMPFLGAVRVVIVRGAEELRAAERRTLWQVAQRAPAGNTLVIEDLQSPGKRTKPETFGELAGRMALRIDVTATRDARARWCRETLAALSASAEPAAVAAIANTEAPLIAVRTDLEKLALSESRITLDGLMRESIVAPDAKGYQAASALVAGDAERALAMMQEMIVAMGDRGAAPVLLSAIAAEYRLVWELARRGGEVPARFRWREQALRPLARKLGARRARRGYERAVRGFESLVTGRADELRTVVSVLAAVATSEGRERRAAQTTENR